MLDYKSLRDPHLNLFWHYGGDRDDVSKLENNITKAFINLLDGSPEEAKIDLCRKLFGIDLTPGGLEFDFYLQKKPEPEKVSSFKAANRLLFAFCPSGKAWGVDGEDTKDEKAIYEALYASLSSSYPEEEARKASAEKATKDVLERRRGGSIPDGWVFIYKDKEPLYVIALENKLVDLDPEQINNHIEKSLLLSSNKTKPIYMSYPELIENIKGITSYLSDQFTEYFVLLGQIPVDDWKAAFSADASIVRPLALRFGRQIATKVHEGEIDKRGWDTWRIHVRYPWLHEINLQFWGDGVYMSLAFGPTQNSGRWMLQNIDAPEIKDDRVWKIGQSFHLLYWRGRNIKDSYLTQGIPLDKYVDYLKRNLDSIRLQTPGEAISFYKKMLEDGFISEDIYRRTFNRLNGKKNKVTVVPEINCVFFWEYGEIAELGLEGFASDCRRVVEKSLKAFKLG